MPVTIESTKFNNAFRPTQDLNYLLGCIGEKITVKIQYYFENIQFAVPDNIITLVPSAIDVGSFSNLQELIWTPDNVLSFVEYEVGDFLQIQGSTAGNNGTFQISQKISNQLVRCGGNTFNMESLPNGAFFTNIPPFIGIRLFYNMIASGSNYNSLIDGEVQQLNSNDAQNFSPSPAAFNGILSYQIGSGTIEFVSNANSRQTFLFTHETFITPFFLANQFSDLVNGIKPSYFTAGACLNYIYKLQLSRNLLSPIAIQQLSILNPANTGWFGETFNGGLTNYSISLFTLQRVSDLVFLTKLEFTNEIEVIINIQNPTIPAPFYFGVTQVCLNFCYLPENATLYQNNGRNQKENFVFDRAFVVSDTGIVNGENYLTPNQVIKSAEVIFMTGNLIQVKARRQIARGA